MGATFLWQKNLKSENTQQNSKHARIYLNKSETTAFSVLCWNHGKCQMKCNPAQPTTHTHVGMKQELPGMNMLCQIYNCIQVSLITET